ncbi:MAG: CHAT domain-containing protein, partial [Candidatus Competibacteraceae bacterium]|nr:CHAT domain-containing protein [Candidatus Competibacteraceae bacterium]
TRRNRHRLAANLATQLIRMGVRAVVAAGWAVDDAAAETFARVFYDRMLDGETFGRAVLHARQETYQNHSGVNTWGAYQCYGDPDYVLTQYRRTENDQSKANYVSPSEVRVDLDDLASQACCASDERISTLLQRVQAIEGQLPEHWKTRSDVQEALGRVYGELYEFEKAVGCYQAAIDSGDDVSTKAIEQRANLLGRWAIQTWLMAQANEDQEASENAISAANTQINDAINELKTLCQLAGNSVERLSLLGSAYKRRALISNSPITSLRNMARFYKEAHELALETKGTINHYPLLNWLAAELVLQRRGLDSKTAPDDFTRLIGQAEQIADAKDREEPNFWNGTIKPECELVHGLTENALDVRQEAIVKGYLAARQRGVSTREFSSVIEHLDFLIEMLSGQAKLCTALKWIKSRL